MNSLVKTLLVMLAFVAFNPATKVAAKDLSKPLAEVSESVEHYELEKPHTQILFFADHLGFSVSNGRFTKFKGHFALDHSDLSNSSVEVIIDASSVYMGHEKWEAHLKNADFLDVETYPEIRFKSESVELVDEKTANVTGMLSLHGVEKQVVLKVTHNKSGTHPFSGKYVSGFTAETSILRSDFGMTFGLPLLADKVDIKIQAEGLRLDAGSEGKNASEE